MVGILVGRNEQEKRTMDTSSLVMTIPILGGERKKIEDAAAEKQKSTKFLGRRNNCHDQRCARHTTAEIDRWTTKTVAREESRCFGTGHVDST